MLDCGIHPGFANEASLPYLDDIDLDEVDVLLVTHFHLDHSAAVPFVVGRTPFKVGPACTALFSHTACLAGPRAAMHMPASEPV